jgi:peptidoglycan/LPS O-acetylase OafA/YrhL
MKTVATQRRKEAAWSLEIEGLRGIAVLLPVIYHANLELFPAGFLGVDIFFVISGYLITGLLWRELFGTGKIGFARFYARRARRILPAAILVIVTSAIATLFVFPDSSYLKRFVDDYIAASLQVFNILQAVQSNSYWAASPIDSPLLHYWSLGVEEQFYIILPILLLLLFLAARKAFRKVESFNLANRLSEDSFSQYAIMAAISLLTLASFYLSATQTISNPDQAYYLLQYRAWQLGAGAITFFLVLKISSSLKQSNVLTHMLGWLGLFFIFYSALAFSSATIWPGYHAGLPVLGTMLVIYATATGKGPSFVLKTRPLRAIGRWSYSLYLWHLPALILTEVALRRQLETQEAVLVILACIAVSAATYKFVEQPVRTSRKLASNRNGLLLGISLILIGLLSAFALYLRGNTIDTTLAQIPQYETLEEQRIAIETWLASSGAVPKSLNPRLGDINFIREHYKPYSNRCHSNARDVPALGEDCTLIPDANRFTNIDSLPRVWIIGDSHAASWYPAFEHLVKEGKIVFTSHSRSGCQASEARLDNRTVSGELSECSQWLNLAVEAVEEARPDILLIGNYYLVSGGIQGIDGFATSMSQYADRVIVLGDYPRWGGLPESCLFKNLDDYSKCIQIISDTDKETREMVKNSIPISEDVEYAPTIDWFCLEDRCPLIVNNVVIMSDTNHLTLESAYMMAPRIEELLFNK